MNIGKPDKNQIKKRTWNTFFKRMLLFTFLDSIAEHLIMYFKILKPGEELSFKGWVISLSAAILSYGLMVFVYNKILKNRKPKPYTNA